MPEFAFHPPSQGVSLLRHLRRLYKEVVRSNNFVRLVRFPTAFFTLAAKN